MVSDRQNIRNSATNLIHFAAAGSSKLDSGLSGTSFTEID
jgi:hypothetical protein